LTSDGDIISGLLKIPEIVLEIIKGVIEMKNLKLELRISEISEESKSKKNNQRHNILANEIFYPLYYNIVYIDIYENKLPTIRFNTQIRDSLLYDD
jgi:hypothetical protein